MSLDCIAKNDSWLFRHPPMSPERVEPEHPLDRQTCRLISDSASSQYQYHRVRSIVFTTNDEVDYVDIAPYADTIFDDFFDVTRLFPNGAISTRICNVPGSEYRLSNNFRIITTLGHGEVAPINAFVRSAFGIDWPGNIVLVRYGLLGVPENISPKHADMYVSLLKSWLTNLRSLQSEVTI